MTGILISDFIIGILIFLRIASALIASPVFGHASIPVLVKLSISLVIAYMVFLTVDKSSIQVEFSLWFLFITAAKEIISGLIIGFALQFIFYAISMAGTFIGIDMGLSMSQVFNPAEGTENNIIGEILYTGAILIFFLIDGHHYVVRGLANSFLIVPVGKFTVNAPVHNLLISYSASVFVIALKIASPIMISFFLIHIGEGIIARVIPQMQVFFITQPLKIGIGFLLLSGLIPVYVYVIKNLLKGYEDNLYQLIRYMGT